MKALSLRLRILGGFLTLLAGVLGSSLAIVGTSQTRQTKADVERQLGLTREVFRSLLARREAELERSVNLLGADFAFKQALLTRSAKTIESNALTLRDRIKADLVWITDEEGRLYADTAGRLKPGQPLLELPVVRQALEEEAVSSAVTVREGAAYQLVAAPIVALGDLYGVLVTGFAVDDAFARTVKDLTLSELSFEAGGGIVASTLGSKERSSLMKACAGLSPGRPAILALDPGRAIVLSDDISKDVTVYIQRSWDEALAPLRRLEGMLLAIGLAGVLLTAAAGFLIARGITAPIAELVAATRRLMAGDYGAEVQVRRLDEVGQLGQAFNGMVSGLREKERIRSVLNKAVSREIAEELLKRGDVKLGGEEKTVTVLFSDVRNFTSISEKLPPAELVSQLNAYFTKMERVIWEHKGVIDKYVGDAIMALFGAPLDSPEDASNALRAALALRRALEEFNAERAAQGLPPWKTGIGVNTGPAVVGNLGSEKRLSYTVIGDAVNLASRVEGLTKHYHVSLLVTRASAAAAAGDFLFRPVDLVRVAGKQEPVEVLELLGEGVPRPDWLAPFEDGVRAYRGRDFGSAKSSFERALALRPDDEVTRDYLQRLELLLVKAPAHWDPARTMSEK